MPHLRSCQALGTAAFLLTTLSAGAAEPSASYAYVGTYTNKGSKGIYLYKFNSASGKLESIGLAAETPNPTFLAVHPNRKYLYAANEIGNFKGTKAGSISAFSIDSATGKLTALNSVSSQGGGPAHVTVDRSGKFVLAANYGGGSVAVLPISADGSLGEATSFIQHSGSSVNKSRQGAPHAHSVNMSPDNKFAIVADLGLDKILVYRFDQERGTLKPNDPPSVSSAPGAGPRHFSFHPNGKFAYSINEMQSTVTVFDWDAGRGVLTEKQTVTTLPTGFSGQSSTAEVLVHPNGKFLYGSNRGDDSIAVFAIGSDGKLTQVEIVPAQVKTPRNFIIHPGGEYLFAEGQNSDKIVLFKLDLKTGRLTPAGTSVDVAAPVCIRFVPIS